ncbi:MAG: glycosyltransferase family 2 protein [Candidatus Bathyarchaeota archaeon]|nr:glycosyltransferase family 2 protein [Candidatus Bathyarchaeota archaeon]
MMASMHKSNLFSDSVKEPVTVGVVIPTLNEEKNIGEVLSELKSLGYGNVLVIDGKSHDDTSKVASKNGAKVVLQIGKGKGSAVRQVLSNGYLDVDALVLMDADGSMDPKEIPVFIEALASGADVAKGSRFLKDAYTHDMSALRRFGNTLMTSVVNMFWPQANYTDLCYGYAAFNKRAVETLAPVLESDNFEIETELFIKSLTSGLVVKEVPSVEYERKNGTSNLRTFRDGFKIFKTIFQEFAASLLH